MQKSGGLGAVEVLLDDDPAAGLGQAGGGVGPGLVEVVGDDDALAGGEAVVLDDVGRAEVVEAVLDLLGRRADVGRAVGTLAAAMTSLANALLPSSCAAAADGPKTRNPLARRTSATPATRGASGPMTTRSTASRGRDLEDGVGVGDVGQRFAAGDGVDAGVPGGGDDRVDGVVRREGPGQGVLARSGAEDEDYPAGHGDHPRANAAERQPAVHGTDAGAWLVE